MTDEKKNKPWVIYCRVSSEEQALEGVSLEVQQSACLALAKAYGYTVGNVIEDPGFSGKDFDRPGMRRVLDMIQKRQIAGIIIWKLDRLVRNLRKLLEFTESIVVAEIQLLSVNEKIDTSGAIGRLFLSMLGALAEFERSQISERVTAALTHLKANGRFYGGPIPTGLEVVLVDGKKFLGPHPRFSPIVSHAFHLVIEGKPLSHIAQYFNEHDVPNRAGKPWSINAVSYVLKQKRLIGHLIDQETYDRCQMALSLRASPGTRRNGKIPSKQAQRPSARIWRLHGLASCAKCESALVGSTARGRLGTHHHFLRCSGRMRRGISFCDARDLPAEQWENAVVSRLIQYLSSEDLTRQLTALMAKRQAGLAPARGQREGLARERDGVQQRLDRALDLCLDGGAVARAYSSKISEMQDRVEKLNVQIAALDGQIAAADMSDATVALTADAFRIGIQHLADLPWQQQKIHLGNVIREVHLASGKDGTIDLRLPEPLDVALSIKGKAGAALVRTGGEQWLRSLDCVRTAEVIHIPLKVREFRGARGKGEVRLESDRPQ